MWHISLYPHLTIKKAPVLWGLCDLQSVRTAGRGRLTYLRLVAAMADWRDCISPLVTPETIKISFPLAFCA